MVKTYLLCQNLAGEPAPADNRADEWRHPVEDGEIIENIKGFSLAPVYSFKQLRAIERRRTKTKLNSQRFRTDATGGMKTF
jgi:hypothetical protein